MEAQVSERLFSKVKKTPHGCWEWQAGRNRPGGYGHFKIDGKKKLVHRLMWEEYNGIIPNGMRVLHKCDNPPCCNPKHLFLGTQTDNIHDMEDKGRARHPRGEHAGNAKLTAVDVLEIRRRRKAGEPMPAIAKDYPFMGLTCLHYAAIGKTWRHLAEVN
jgi:hypothetical protein